MLSKDKRAVVANNFTSTHLIEVEEAITQIKEKFIIVLNGKVYKSNVVSF